jgi:hypothetical protein
LLRLGRPGKLFSSANILPALLAACLWGLVPLDVHAQVVPKDRVKSPQDTVTRRPDSLAATDVILEDSTQKVVIPADSNAVVTGDTTAPDSGAKPPKPRKGFRLSTAKDYYNPKTAVRRSLVLPGWGQIYNNRWWKVPIIYAGFGACAALIIGNNQGYVEYDRAVKCKGDSTCILDPHPEYSLESALAIREEYRRYRDLSIIICGLWYVLQAVDSYVDAHLRGFNVSDDFSAFVEPNVMIDPFRKNSLYTGFSVTFKLRR